MHNWKINQNEKGCASSGGPKADLNWFGANEGCALGVWYMQAKVK